MAFPDDSLLPGAGNRNSAAPTPVYNARQAISSARRRALLSDVLDVGLLAGVDVIFARWTSATLPFLSRMTSLEILVLANLAILGACVLRRKMPQWRARRISRSWSPTERERRDV
jgi:hypothetical protein